MSNNEEILNSTEQEAPAQEAPQVAEATQAAPEATQEAPNLLEAISEDLRDQGNIKDFKDVNQLAKSYVELQRMVGNSVRIPSEDASDEAKQEFLNKIKGVEGVLLKTDEQLYDKLGRPEKPEGYDLQEALQAEIANSVPGFEDEINTFRDIAHENGLTNEQAAKLVDMRVKTLEATRAAQEAQKEDAVKELKRMWGEDYDNRIQAATKVAGIYKEKYGEVVQDLVEGPAGRNPAFLNMLSELAEVYTEKRHEGMSGTKLGLTAEGAKSKIAEKRADSGFMKALNDDIHPNHAKAVEEMTKLYQIANSN